MEEKPVFSYYFVLSPLFADPQFFSIWIKSRETSDECALTLIHMFGWLAFWERPAESSIRGLMVDLLRSSVCFSSTFAALQIDRAPSKVAPQVQREKGLRLAVLHKQDREKNTWIVPQSMPMVVMMRWDKLEFLFSISTAHTHDDRQVSFEHFLWMFSAHFRYFSTKRWKPVIAQLLSISSIEV